MTNVGKALGRKDCKAAYTGFDGYSYEIDIPIGYENAASSIHWIGKNFLVASTSRTAISSGIGMHYF